MPTKYTINADFALQESNSRIKIVKSPNDL